MRLEKLLGRLIELKQGRPRARRPVRTGRVDRGALFAAPGRRGLWVSLRAAFQVVERSRSPPSTGSNWSPCCSATSRCAPATPRSRPPARPARPADRAARACPTPSTAPSRHARSRQRRSPACRQRTRSGHASAAGPTCSASTTPPCMPSAGQPGAPAAPSHIRDLSTSTSQPGANGSKPCSINQRTISRLRNDHHAWITSRSMDVP